MEKEIRKQPRRSMWIAAMGVVMLLLAAAAAMLVLNRYTLSIRLRGDAEITVEYGESYVDPGAELYLSDTFFWKEGIRPRDGAVNTYSNVRQNKLGKYTVIYSAEYRGMRAEGSRTVRIVDTQPPQIILTPDPEGTLLPGTPYEEAGFQAVDNYDGDITHRVKRIEEYGKIIYSVTDSSGNPCYAERIVPYYDPVPPEIILEGGAQISITAGTVFEDPGYAAWDNVDGDLTQQVAVTGEVDWLTPGTYVLTYQVSDGFQNKTSVTRTVEVIAKEQQQTVTPEGKVIYLTFDDGPGPYTEQLLDILDDYGVKATFFVTDSGYDDVMKQIVEQGHSIGIHTVSHNYREIYSSPEAYFEDLYRMQEIIYENTGVMTTLMRFPGGSSNTISSKTYEGLMTILTKAVQDAGFQYFDWNVDSNDAGGAKKPEQILENVKQGVMQCRVSVVLQHDIHAYSVEAVEDIIIWGLNNGYSFQALTSTSPAVHHNVYN